MPAVKLYNKLSKNLWHPNGCSMLLSMDRKIRPLSCEKGMQI